MKLGVALPGSQQRAVVVVVGPGQAVKRVCADASIKPADTSGCSDVAGVVEASQSLCCGCVHNINACTGTVGCVGFQSVNEWGGQVEPALHSWRPHM